MSNLDAVTKIADQILSRIFDQRQFTGGEISYLATELGEQAYLTENFDKLLKINEAVCVLNDMNRDEFCSKYDERRVEIGEHVSSLVDKAESILRLGAESRERAEQSLAATRNELEHRKEECLRDCNAKLKRLQESIVSEELELERKYLKFEENLRSKK